MKWLVSIALAGCTASPRNANDPALPDGVFTPDHQIGASEVRVARDADSLWFTYTTGPARDLWLAAMTLEGDASGEPQRIDTVGAAQPAITVSDDAIAIAYRSEPGRVHVALFDGAIERSVASIDFPSGSAPSRFELVDRPGGYHLVANGSDSSGEIVVHDLDARGEASGANMRLAAAPAAMPTQPDTLRAIGRSDGRTLVVWDRVFENCTGRLPYEAFAASTSPTVQPLFDSPGQSEWQPALAAFDANAYAAWRTDFELYSTISMARFDQPDVVLAEAGDVGAFNSHPVLAMSGPTRGAIVWQNETEYRLATFVDNGASITLGAIHTVLPIADVERVSSLTHTNFVSVGDDRYLLAWVENEHSGETRIYARVIDLAAPPSPTPPRASVPRGRARLRPCSH